jgi:hypothetical protein
MVILEGVNHCWLESEFGFRPCDLCGLGCIDHLNKEKALGSHKPKTS